MRDEWKKFESYEDYLKNKWHPQTPIARGLLTDAGGEIVYRRGRGDKVIVRMPDNALFEEGTGQDGACYPASEERLREIQEL